METYRVKVLTPGHMLVFRGLRCRTPVEFKNIRLQEMKSIELQARTSSLKYEIMKESDINDNDIKIEELNFKSNIEESVTEETSVEELEENTSPKTILEKLISDEKE
jgi:hypothetical protein